MFVRLEPQQVSGSLWESIEGQLSIALDMKESDMSIVLRKLLAGAMQCWISSDEDGVNAVALTQLINEEPSETKKLFINAIVELYELPLSVWMEAVETLRGFGRLNGCKSVIAQTNNARVLKMVKLLGWDTVYRVVENKI